ncbi:MFS transporter [Pseudomonas sp. NMI542_15]|uniref:MFS transporter n=1 Tax=Pseudomonas sp. NMI542_15 TaxID=2903148 RepID=UPI001E3A9EED|nr:MFS transporter [Pseudomonas sp. NMI542_15]MCE0777552.1 MFS transporter [Pseudomonas sp. NMI542_15]
MHKIQPSPRLQMTALIAYAAITASILLTTPVIAAQLALERGLDAAQVGLLFSIEHSGMSLAALPALWWLKRVNWRYAATVAASIYIIGNIASAMVEDYGSLQVARAVSSFAAGSLMILSLSCAARHPNPSRAYGAWVLGQLVLGAICLAVLPRLYGHFGLPAGYLLLAGLMIIALPLARGMPHSNRAKPAPQGHAKTFPLLKALLGSAALLGFYVALSSVWTFIGAIGKSAGLSANASGDILAVATLFGIGGATTATAIGGRWRRAPLLCAGFGMMIVSMGLLMSDPQLARYTLAIFIFKFTWTYTLPFILANLAAIDQSGRLMGISNLVIGTGIGTGPILAGFLISHDPSFSYLLICSASIAALSLLLILSGRRLASSHPLTQSI